VSPTETFTTIELDETSGLTVIATVSVDELSVLFEESHTTCVWVVSINVANEFK
jgi:hypothetical protein